MQFCVYHTENFGAGQACDRMALQVIPEKTITGGTMNNILSPSILAADFCRLGEQIKELEQAGAQYLHIDVMDGNFVPDISFGMPVIESIRNCSDIFFDVHLMIERPERYIKAFVDCGSDMINIHLEATEDVEGTIGKIKL